MKLLNVSYSDLFGGAAKSSFRIHKCINNFNKTNIESKMIVIKKLSKDKKVFKISGKLNAFMFKIKNYIGMMFGKFDNSENPKSYNFFNSPVLNYINNSECDVVNLHWINAETLSIDDVNKIKKPFVITMHDMWWICSTENYLPLNDKKWITGYKNSNFISKYFWNKKRKLKPKGIICPSSWLLKCVKKSYLMKNKKTIHIPYPVNRKIFYPQKVNQLSKLNIFKNKKVKIFFSVFGDPKDHRKGIDLLIKSLEQLDPNSFELIVASNNFLKDNLKFKTISLSQINNEKILSKIYNLCDFVVLPSRLDNLPNVGLEAQSCAKPIIAFDVGGISDIVDDKKNGYLIKPYNTKEFSKKIEKLIKDKKIRLKFSKNANLKAKKYWSENIIQKKYSNFFNNLNLH